MGSPIPSSENSSSASTSTSTIATSSSVDAISNLPFSPLWATLSLCLHCNGKMRCCQPRLVSNVDGFTLTDVRVNFLIKRHVVSLVGEGAFAVLISLLAGGVHHYSYPTKKCKNYNLKPAPLDITSDFE